MIDLIFRNF